MNIKPKTMALFDLILLSHAVAQEAKEQPLTVRESIVREMVSNEHANMFENMLECLRTVQRADVRRKVVALQTARYGTQIDETLAPVLQIEPVVILRIVAKYHCSYELI